jgi:uncharacterized repeat protein (TIGR03803 family)
MPTTRTSSPRKTVGRKLAFVLALLLALPLTALAQTFTSLVEFNQTAGANPHGTLAGNIDGNFYGTTQFGGADGQGTVYRATSKGVLSLLYSFCGLPGCTDGLQPFAGLQLGFDQNFYGTTIHTVYRITTTGQLATLYTFCSQPNCADGDFAYAHWWKPPAATSTGQPMLAASRPWDAKAVAARSSKSHPSAL